MSMRLSSPSSEPWITRDTESNMGLRWDPACSRTVHREGRREGGVTGARRTQENAEGDRESGRVDRERERERDT